LTDRPAPGAGTGTGEPSPRRAAAGAAPPALPAPPAPGPEARVESCDICGSTDLADLRCKVICRNCHTILKSCADL